MGMRKNAKVKKNGKTLRKYAFLSMEELVGFLELVGIGIEEVEVYDVD